MALGLMTKYLPPCAGTPVHELTCGHTVHECLFYPFSLSRCAPNCKNVALNTGVEPSFLCPQCYEAHLRRKYKALMKCYTEEAERNKVPLKHMVKRVKQDYETADGISKNDKAEFERWYKVLLCDYDIRKAFSESYKDEVETKGLRASSAIEK